MERRTLYIQSRAAWECQQVAVADAWIEFYSGTAEMLVHCSYEFSGLVCGDMASTVVFDNSVFLSYYVTSKGNVVRSQFHSNAGRFQRIPAGIEFGRVIAQDEEVCNIRTGPHIMWNSYGLPRDPFHCNVIHIGCMGKLQGGLAVKFVQGVICHAIAQEYNIFHSQVHLRV
jgi:hypothetical protein